MSRSMDRRTLLRSAGSALSDGTGYDSNFRAVNPYVQSGIW
ncbi:hypothetical protein [Streptomyces pseudovenezuelae]|uniref:Uncharacterized protein n=1 Tax=Streptomyces pseudovenezuelae TaxID=67350 RepID=A0ABT6LQQ3_9ACTN|nr:hypothetical protein [Streptomyces pseudovenezuelae]MDH6218647.1 hypothetical protein [Streptomyces pseudovenezuelae]